MPELAFLLASRIVTNRTTNPFAHTRLMYAFDLHLFPVNQCIILVYKFLSICIRNPGDALFCDIRVLVGYRDGDREVRMTS